MLLAFLNTFDSSIHEGAAAMGWPAEAFLRLFLAALAGGLVGLEREVRGRQAGFRTNLLVCLGSTLVMMISIQFAAYPFHAPAGVNVGVDPARIAYGVMMGVGFLGAGTIMHSGGSVRGLTTAAGLWCVAAIGLAIGFGMYVVAGGAVVLVLGALWFLDYIEEVLPRQKFRTLTVRTPYHPGCVAEIVEHVRKTGLRVLTATFARDRKDLSWADVHLHVTFFDLRRYHELERQLESDDRYSLLETRET